MDQALRTTIRRRSGDRCEAETWRSTPRSTSGTWRRCGSTATEVHHLLTKARGGRNLDRVGETYHLIHLCNACHRLCDGQDAYDGGMLIEGEVTWDRLWNRPVYRGPDEYLSMKYPEPSFDEVEPEDV